MIKSIFLILFIISIASATSPFDFHNLNNARIPTKKEFTTKEFSPKLKFSTLASACGSNNTCSSLTQCTFGYCGSNNICMAPQILNTGAVCTKYDYCLGGPCVISGSSTTGICTAGVNFNCACTFNSTAAIPNNGQYSSSQTCITGICLSNGICDYLRPAGFSCKINAQCQSNVCSVGSCTSNTNYGAACNYQNSTCPADAACGYNGTGAYVCIQNVGLGQGCNPNLQCGNGLYCDTSSVPNTCKLFGQNQAGQTCAVSQNQCTLSTYCNTTTSTCVSYNTVNNMPCDSVGNNYCPGPFNCGCSGSTSVCSQIENYNCDNQNAAYTSCIANNCATQNINNFFDSQNCVIKNCQTQIASLYCCVLNFNSQFTQYSNSAIGSFFDCSKNTFKSSPCASGTNLQISLYTLFSAILFIFSFFL